ncbi:MAG: metal ABC transporter substrate-binding protein [Candidatus Coproplasma sp.]
MKKFFALLCAILIGLPFFGVTGCTSDDGVKKKIVCTIFPQYDWVVNILGDKSEEYELCLLTDTGVDLHNYQPSFSDVAKIAASDLFIYVGGESDGWVEGTLASYPAENRLTICMIDLVDAIEEEESEGEEEHDHDHGEEEEYDEHVWLSLRNAQTIVGELTEKICVLDKDNAAYYRTNAENYNKKLDELDAQYAEVVAGAKYNTLVVADRFPFLYTVRDYGLNYYAAFSGCSAATEISLATKNMLVNALNDLKLGCVIVTESSDKSVAQSVIAASDDVNRQILVLDSCQTVNRAKIQSGYTYLGAMTANLETLRSALN